MSLEAFRRILSPVDLSDTSARSLRWASLLAGRLDGEVVVLHADRFNAPAYFTDAQINDLRLRYREAQAGAEESLRGFAQKLLGAGDIARIRTRFVEAEPVEAILSTAAGEKAGLIVMGTHGRSGINRLLMGSVAERVIRESRTPVLTVCGNCPEVPLEGKPLSSILCPVANNDPSRTALRAASELASRFDAVLEVLHVKEPGAHDVVGDLKLWIDACEKQHCNLRWRTESGNPAERIIKVAREIPASLLVLGTHHKTFIDATVLGANVIRIVRHATVPVLTIPDAGQSPEE